MVAFLFGLSIAFNCTFIGLWILGIRTDKRYREAQKHLYETQAMSSITNKNWMYDV
tara:strand:- start:1734 stop:1901 length:168 start_codon:yes stop_codon:yes gene_type:complete